MCSGQKGSAGVNEKILRDKRAMMGLYQWVILYAFPVINQLEIKQAHINFSTPSHVSVN